MWVKRPKSGGDDSFPPIAEVKKNWSYIPTPPCAFMTCTGTIKTLYYPKDAKIYNS